MGKIKGGVLVSEKDNNILNEKALEYAKGTAAIEGLYLSEEQEKLIREKAEGKITHEEFIKRAVELANGK